MLFQIVTICLSWDSDGVLNTDYVYHRTQMVLEICITLSLYMTILLWYTDAILDNDYCYHCSGSYSNSSSSSGSSSSSSSSSSNNNNKHN